MISLKSLYDSIYVRNSIIYINNMPILRLLISAILIILHFIVGIYFLFMFPDYSVIMPALFIGISLFMIVSEIWVAICWIEDPVQLYNDILVIIDKTYGNVKDSYENANKQIEELDNETDK
jgi:hypothetical protein